MTATTPKELAQLRDIHLPEAIGWWPIAPGWYILAVLLIMMVSALVFFLRRHYLQGRVKRQALREWVMYHQEYQQEQHSQISAAKLSELLKRVALMYFPRNEVASLQGDAWIVFLNQTSKQLDFNAK